MYKHEDIKTWRKYSKMLIVANSVGKIMSDFLGVITIISWIF